MLSQNGSIQCITIGTNEDEFIEDSESFAVELRVSGNDIIEGNSSPEIVIEDNDSKFIRQLCTLIASCMSYFPSSVC